jgi:hypothetical protein
MPTSTSLIEVPADFLSQVFGVAKSLIAGGLIWVIAAALGLFLGFFLVTFFIAKIKQAVAARRARR